MIQLKPLNEPSAQILDDFQRWLYSFYHDPQQDPFNGDHLVQTFTYYFNFLKHFADPKLTYCNAKQWEAYELALREYEVFWWRSRRAGKTIGMANLEIFYSLIGFGEAYAGVVVHKTPAGPQLEMLYKWMNCNPFCTNINRQTHKVSVLNSEEIWATMTTKDNVDGYGCSALFEDEWGTVNNTDLKKTYLESAREFILEGSKRGKRHFHASTVHYNSVGDYDIRFLEDKEARDGKQYVHIMPWTDCRAWINRETIEDERLKHFENPAFIKEMFECIRVPKGGLFFNTERWVVAGSCPEYPIELLDRYSVTSAGWDFNGDTVGHIEVRGHWDYANKLVVVLEEKAWDKTTDISDHIKQDYGVSHEVEGVPKKDGYNAGFAQHLLELETPCQYQHWEHITKQGRLAILQNAFVLIHPSCKWVIQNFRDAITDPNKIEVVLKKTNKQHGLDACLHLVHSTNDTIDFAARRHVNTNPYATEQQWL